MSNVGLGSNILWRMSALVDTPFRSQQNNHAIHLPLRYRTYDGLLTETQMDPLYFLIFCHTLFLPALPTNSLCISFIFPSPLHLTTVHLMMMMVPTSSVLDVPSYRIRQQINRKQFSVHYVICGIMLGVY